LIPFFFPRPRNFIDSIFTSMGRFLVFSFLIQFFSKKPLDKMPPPRPRHGPPLFFFFCRGVPPPSAFFLRNFSIVPPQSCGPLQFSLAVTIFCRLPSRFFSQKTPPLANCPRTTPPNNKSFARASSSSIFAPAILRPCIQILAMRFIALFGTCPEVERNSSRENS